MKRLVLLLALLALALLGAWLWHVVAADPGYVLVALHGYSIETTLVVALAAVLVTWILIWLLLVLVRFPLRYWRRRRRQVARECLAGGLVALHEGRWRRAEKLLARAARDSTQRLPALLGAARAAQQRGDDAAAEELLVQAAAEHDPVSIALLAARRHQRHGDAAAIAALFDAEPIAALPPRAVQLYLAALVDTGRAGEAVALLPALRSSQALEGHALEEEEARILAAALQQAPDAASVTSLWTELSRARKTHALVAGAYARRMSGLGDADAAIDAIDKALRRGWSAELVQIFGRVPRGATRSPLRLAESWLAAHPDDPDLLVTLGRLCRTEQIWGKAAEYLQRALAHGAGARAWEELGHLHAAQHDDGAAREAYARALTLARTDMPDTLPTDDRRERIAIEAEPEVRSSMGVPLLPDAVDAPYTE